MILKTVEGITIPLIDLFQRTWLKFMTWLRRRRTGAVLCDGGMEGRELPMINNPDDNEVGELIAAVEHLLEFRDNMFLVSPPYGEVTNGIEGTLADLARAVQRVKQGRQN